MPNAPFKSKLRIFYYSTIILQRLSKWATEKKLFIRQQSTVNWSCDKWRHETSNVWTSTTSIYVLLTVFRWFKIFGNKNNIYISRTRQSNTLPQMKGGVQALGYKATWGTFKPLSPGSGENLGNLPEAQLYNIEGTFSANLLILIHSNSTYTIPCVVLLYLWHVINNCQYTVNGFIFVGTNFRWLIKNHVFVGFKIRSPNIFIHLNNRNMLHRGYWNSWFRPSTKTTKIGTPRNFSQPPYLNIETLSCRFSKSSILWS